MLLPWVSGSKHIWMRSFKWGTMQPCSSKGCKTAVGQNCRSGKNHLTNQGRLMKVCTGVKKDHFFLQNSTLIFSNSTFLWATRLHSTSFERSDSYLLRFSLKIGITALLRYFIFAQRCDIYLTFRGHRANQTPLAFFRILERSWPLTSIFLLWISRYMLCLLVLKRKLAVLALICSKSRNLTTWQFCFTTL